MDEFFERMREQFDELLKDQPLLTDMVESDDFVRITGTYVLHEILNSELFSDSFHLDITVLSDFPRSVPKVKELGKRISTKNYRDHIYPDRTLCLEVNTRIIMELDGNPSLYFFNERFIKPYLLGFLYYQKNRRFPFGDYSHGSDGLLEFYCKLFNVDDKPKAKQLLGLVFDENYKGHRDCPCGSGKRFRNCHSDQIVSFRESKFMDNYFSDYIFIEG